MTGWSCVTTTTPTGRKPPRQARSRLTDSVETAMEMGDGVVIVNDVTDPANPTDHLFSEHYLRVRPRQPAGDRAAHLSVQQPAWGPPHLPGLGVRREFDPDLVVPNPNLSVRDGALAPWVTSSFEQLDAHNPARSLPQLRHSGQRTGAS